MSAGGVTLVLGVARATGLLVVSLMIAGLLAAGLLAAGCSGDEAVPAISGDSLAAGTTYSADLDGDGAPERIYVDPDVNRLTITDGDLVYRSRDKWKVVKASLGDTDHDGLPEVVTLLDDDEGRHIGLFAYFGGAYRERLVTSEIVPRPISLQVVSAGDAETNSGVVGGPGDLILLTQEPAAGQTGGPTIILRWNGFSFSTSPGTSLETAPSE